MSSLLLELSHLIMQATPSSRGSGRTSVSATRQTPCTHTRMVRVYGPYRCQNCLRVPQQGWVYRCSEDLDAMTPWEFVGADELDMDVSHRTAMDGSNSESGWLPEIMFEQKKMDNPNLPANVENLKAPIQQAVTAGQYNEEQVDILLRQRRELEQARTAALARENASLFTNCVRTATFPQRHSFVTNRSPVRTLQSMGVCSFRSCAACR
jgi:hypothetical protein